jgi:hypothetical protein
MMLRDGGMQSDEIAERVGRPADDHGLRG